jgi:hypothetical protein
MLRGYQLISIIPTGIFRLIKVTTDLEYDNYGKQTTNNSTRRLNIDPILGSINSKTKFIHSCYMKILIPFYLYIF